MKKELELESEQFYPIKTDDLICSPKLVRDGYIAGATSKWAEKQKLEFAIEQLNEIKSKMSFFEISNMENTLDNLHYKIQDLEQKLSEL